MKHTLLCVMICIACNNYAQTYDDFEDGNFTQNPSWNGDHELFKINTSNQLQLDDSDENQSYLCTENSITQNVEWRFWVKLAFSPSSNNYARFYLVSNSHNLLEPLEGYYLQLGESGSDDAIELFRQDGVVTTSVCRGSNGVLSSSFEIRIKIIRNHDGTWMIYSDNSGGENFLLECSGVDDTYSLASHIGIQCKYTKSNSSKMYFDDIYVGPIIVDNEPPVLMSVAPENHSLLLLYFNEAIAENTVEVLENYFVDDDLGYPKSANVNSMDPTIIELLFDGSFELGKVYEISVTGIRDLADNIMDPTSMTFKYYEPQPYDIVINEIMVDPTPVLGLPEYEYIELYNQSSSDIELQGWKLIIGSSEKNFTSVVIPSYGYLILAKEIAYYDFIDIGEFYGFESFSLTNGGQSLELLDDGDIMISSISYSKSWYGDSDKSEGGWSIEQMNPHNICSGAENWSASNDNSGGTPGSINSLSSDNILYPEIKYFTIISENVIQLYFNQNMDEESMSSVDNYSINRDVATPQYTYTYYDEPNKVELFFDLGLHKGISYELLVSSSIKNCMNLSMPDDTILILGLPEVVDPNDIVINEILFNPLTDGEDYVEIYNRSDKIVDLSGLKIGSIKTSLPNPPDTSLQRIIQRQRLLLPDEYLVLTSNSDAVKKQYYTSNPNGFINIESFPSFNNEDGHVFLSSFDGIVIDSFSYHEDLHFPLLVFKDGVSLECINPDVMINDNNWHSASENVGFGTPGYENSQSVSMEVNGDEITIEPEIFSPDNDGFDDIVNIIYKFNTPGYMMTITVLNSDGYQVKKLANNRYVGAAGSVSWDGIQDNNSKAPVGIYIFLVQVFDLKGNVKKFKKIGVLATYL